MSNIMLNELDKELLARWLRFTRYADECVIAVRSEESAKRVMRTITDWIQRKLGLKVNMTKKHITRPQKLKYLGFGFYKDSRAKGMEMQTALGFCEEIQKKAQRTDL